MSNTTSTDRRWDRQMNKIQDRVSQLAVYGFGMTEAEASELVGEVQDMIDERYGPPSDDWIERRLYGLRQRYGRTRRGPR